MTGHPPRGRPPTIPAARNPHRACRPRGQCWAPAPRHPRPQHVGGGPQQPAPVGGQSGEGQRLASDAPHNDGRQPPGDALPPPAQRATPARRGARCGAGAGSPRPHRPHPGHRVAKNWLPTPEGRRPGEGQRLTPGAPHDDGRHPPGGRPSATPTASNAGPQGRTLWNRCWVTGRGTLAARSRGRAAGGGTAPDTRRPSQRWQTTLWGQPPTTPAARSPHRACRPEGQCWAPTPTHPRPQHVGGGPQQPAQ